MSIDVKDILEELIDEKTAIEVDPNEVLDELLEDETDDEGIEESEELDEFEFGDDEFVYDEDEDDNDEDEDEDYEEPVKPTKDEKKEYAWAEMRKENKRKQEELDRLNAVAESYGFKNHSEMLDKLEEDRLIKEARAKGQDPELFKKINSMENEIVTLRKEKEAELEREKAVRFLNSVDTFIEKNNLTDKEKEELIANLDADGFTVNDLVKIKNKDKLYEGYMSATLKERERQESLKLKEKRQALEEEKFTGTGEGSQATLNDIIDNMVTKARRTKY